MESAQPAPSRRGMFTRPWQARGLVALLYAALVAVYTWPLPVAFWSQVILARGSDLYPHIWNLWWVRFSLFTLHANPYQTDYLQYPSGMPLVFHVLDPINSIVSIPPQMAFGLVAAFNLMRFVHLSFAALAAYALGRTLRLSRPAAWVSGALFLLCPILSDSVDLGQLVEISVGWIPLYALCLIRWLGSHSLGIAPGKPRWLVGAVLSLVAAGLATWYFFVALLIFTVLYVLWESGLMLLPKRDRGRDQAARPDARSGWGTERWREPLVLVGKAALVGAIAVVLLSPLIIALVRQTAAGGDFVVTPQRTVIANSADLLALFVPAPAHVRNDVINPHGSNPALGWTVIALGILGLVPFRRAADRSERAGRWFWALVAVAFALLALGPHLLVAGNDTGVPMPFWLLGKLPFLGTARVPLRFVLLTSLALALLAGFGLTFLASAISRRGPRLALAGAVTVLLAVELLGIPRVLFRPVADPIFETIAAQGADGDHDAVLELPQEKRSAPAMFVQTVHQRPILGGYTARHYPYPWLDAAPGVAQLARSNADALQGPDIITPTVKDVALLSLDYFGVRYVAVYKTGNRALDSRTVSTVNTVFYDRGISPLFEDTDVTVYKVPTQPHDRPFVGLGEGWYPIEGVDSGRAPWRWTNGQARLLLTNPTGSPLPVRLSLSAYSVDGPRTLVLLLDGTEVGRAQVNVHPAQSLAFDLDLTAGDHWVELQSVEPPISPSGDSRKLALGFERVAVEKR